MATNPLLAAIAFYIVPYIVLEAIYLTTASKLYVANIERVTRSRFNSSNVMLYGGVTYLILFVVVYILVIRNITPKTNNTHIIIQAATLGLAIYGIYNFTNMATMPTYSLSIAIMDTVWGVVAITSVAIIYKTMLKVVKF